MWYWGSMRTDSFEGELRIEQRYGGLNARKKYENIKASTAAGYSCLLIEWAVRMERRVGPEKQGRHLLNGKRRSKNATMREILRTVPTRGRAT